MKFTPLFAALLLACSAAQSPTSDRTDPDDEAAQPSNVQHEETATLLAAYFEPLIDGERVHSVAVGVRRGEQVDLAAFSRERSGEEADADLTSAAFEIGSATKVYTALLFAVLVERGDLEANATIGDTYSGEVELPEHIEQISLRSLATHHSGLPRMPDAFAPQNLEDPYADFDVEWLFEALSAASLHEPSFEYSNFGAAVLGQLLAMVAESSYEDAITSLILEPLGLTNTGFDKANLVRGHTTFGTEGTPWNFRAFAPAGALVSTPEDQLRFLEAQLNPPDSALGRAIRRTQLVTHELGSQSLGLGWMIGGGMHWHNGQTGAFHSLLAFSSEHAVAVVAVADTAAMEVDEAALRLAQRLAGNDIAPPDYSNVEVSPDLLARYAGEYELAEGFTLTMLVEDSQLHVQATGQPPYPLYATGEPHEFELRVTPARAVFELPAEGNATAVTWSQGGADTRALRTGP